MAARLNPRNTESVLQKIKAGQLLEKLQKHALESEQMVKSQVTAATWLLDRILARAEAPKHLNVDANVKFTIVTGVPGE
jgi:hypothetical protein